MERLQTLYGSVNAYINKLSSNGELQIHVLFVDNKNKLHILVIERVLAEWKITEQERHPAWVTSLEEQLNSLIKKTIVGEYYLSKAS